MEKGEEKGREEKIKGNEQKKKRGKVLLLSLFGLKSRISLTWEAELGIPLTALPLRLLPP